MNATDKFLSHYEAQISWHYDCVDRIVLNGMFLLGQSPGGFRYWWRELFGSDENLSDESMRKLAGDFARRIYGWARKSGVPVLESSKGERKDELAFPYVLKAEEAQRPGVFLVVSGLAPAPVWRVKRNPSGAISNIHREKPWPFVKHWHFHIWDEQWGHVIVRVCGYPPYGLQVILNGHEWVKRQLGARAIGFQTDGNAFAAGDIGRIRYWSRRLMGESGADALAEVCRRWVYSSVLCFAMHSEERRRTGFEYDWRIFQLEYSRNYLFHSGRAMGEIHNGMIDRNRGRLGVREVKTIFGVRGRPHQRLRDANEPRGRRDTAFKTVKELEHDLSVFKLHWGNSTLKVYDKGARLLRVEAVEHNIRKTKTRGRLECWAQIVQGLGDRVVRFINTLELLDHGMLDMGCFEAMRKPSLRGLRRLAGIDLDNARMRHAVEALISLAPKPEGFTRTDLVNKVKERSGGHGYTKRQASYDMSKLRGKGVILKVPKSRRYRIVDRKLQQLATLHTVREKVLKPLHAKAGRGIRQPIHFQTPEDQCLERLRSEMCELFDCLNIQVA